MSSEIEEEIKLEYKEYVEEDPLAENELEEEHEKPVAELVSELIEHEETSENPLTTLISEREQEECVEKKPIAACISKSGAVVPQISVPLVEANDATQFLQDVQRKVPENEINDATSLLQKADKKASEDAEDSSTYIMDTVDRNPENAVTWYKRIDSYGKLVCNFCDRSYSVLTSLRYHVNVKHPEKVATLKKNILQKRRSSHPTCHLCKKRFKLLTDLKSHIKEHKTENVANSCRYCNAAFSNTQEVIEHLNNNHNVLYKMRHMCNTCGYRTHKLSHLKQHINTHLAEKHNKCAYCDYATNHKSNLRNHERIHTKHKPFVCDFKGCGKKFSDQTGLNYHIQKHCPEKNMLQCDKCSYRTVYRQSLKVHVESHMRR